jgi:hypothetical protein
VGKTEAGNDTAARRHQRPRVHRILIEPLTVLRPTPHLSGAIGSDRFGTSAGSCPVELRRSA